MSQTVPMRQGDTRPSLVATLLDGTGQPVDLTGADSVAFHMGQRGVAAKVSGAAQVLEAEDGRVGYSWSPTDTDTPGIFDADFEVTWSTGVIETFPSTRGDLQVKIDPEIA